MNFVNLSLLTLPLKEVPANGVENPPSTSSLCWVGQTTTKASFFAELVVKHLFVPLPVLLAAK